MRLPLLAAASQATCCCPHHAEDANCRCPVCTQLRELRSGKPYFKTCGGHADESPFVEGPALSIPVVIGAPEPRPQYAVVAPRDASPPPDPVLDIPTPPPLARS